MFKLANLYSEDMALAIVVWFCSLPIIAFIAVPLFGAQIAWLAAAVLLIIIMAACWAVCSWKLVKKAKDERKTLS